MPTGYTAAVVDGSVTEFDKFALSCARAFGALITMRDDPSDAPIPDEIKPHSYNAERLVEAKATLAELESLTTNEVAERAEASFIAAIASHDAYEIECIEQDGRLEAMEAKVLQWCPPSASHTELKAFMLQQIDISKRGSFRATPPVRQIPEDWHKAAITKTMRDIEYHAGEHAKEVERASSRTNWIKQLKASLSKAEGHIGQELAPDPERRVNGDANGDEG